MPISLSQFKKEIEQDSGPITLDQFKQELGSPTSPQRMSIQEFRDSINTSEQQSPSDPTLLDNVISGTNQALEGLYDTAKDTWTRLGRGAAYTYLPAPVVTQYADDDRFEQPGFMESLPLATHDLYSLADLGVEALTGYNLPEADRAAEIGELGQQGLEQMSGQETPSNLIELGLEILSGGAMPVPAASRLPASIRFGTDLVSPISPVTSIPEWGRFTLGTSLPGIGLIEGLDYSVGMPEYQGVFSTLQADDREPSNVRDIDTQREQPVDHEAEASEDRVNVSSTLLTMGAGLVGGALVARQASRALGLDQYPMPTGTSITNAERLTTTLFDESHATVQQLGRQLRDQGYTPEQIAQRQAEVITNRPVNTAADIQNFWNTGRLQTDIGEINLGISPQRVATDLSYGPERTNMRRLIDLRDEMDNRIEAMFHARRGTSSIADRPMSVEAQGMSMRDLRLEIQRLESIPNVRRTADQYSQVMEGSLRYARDRGLISNDLFNTIRQSHPHFRPDMVIPATGSGGIIRNLIERFNRVGQRSGLGQPIRERTHDPKTREMYDPVEAMDRYISGLITDADINRTRRIFFESMGARAYNSREAATRALRRKVDTDHANDHIVEVYGIRNDSRPSYFTVDDPLVGNFLRQDPKYLGLLARSLNSMRKGFQYGTTGPGAPWFAPQSVLYDMGLALRGGGRGTRTGYLPSMLSDIGVPDVTLPVSMMEAFVRSIGANTALGMSNALYRVAIRDDSITTLLGGEQNVRRFANLFQRYYDKSYVALANQDRALGGRFNVDWQDSIARLATVNAGTSFYRSYRASLNAVQDAVRMSTYIRNYDPNMSFARRRELGRTVREIGADFTRIGQNPVVQSSLGTIPYANVGIQAFRRYAQVAKDNPLLFATTTAAFTMPTIMLILEAARRGEEYVDYLFNRLSITDRISNDYIVGDEGPEDFVRINKALPEDTMARSLVYAWMDANFGFSTGEYKSTDNLKTLDIMRMIVSPETWSNVPLEDIGEGLTAAAGRIVQPSIPPAANMLLNLGGVQARPDRAFGGAGDILSDINQSFIPEGDFVTDTLHNARAEAIINNAFGMLGSMFIDAAQQAERAITDEERTYYDAAQAATDTFASRALNMIPTGQLWSNYVNRQPNFGDRIQRVNDKLYKIDRINEQYRTYEIGMGDFARERGQYNPRGTLTSIGPEFEMPAGEIRNFASVLNRNTAYRDTINGYRDEINSIQQRTDLDLNERTTMLNEVIRKKAAIEYELDRQIEEFERGLIQRHGVDIDTVANMLR